MHYKIKDINIKSENSAKSVQQSSNYLVSWLLNHDRVDSALDYGCGKLRYTGYLSTISSSLAITDSLIQLNRRQRINRIETTVREYVKIQWPTCVIYDLETFWSGIHEKYNFILCANVLSAIPSAKIRAKSLKAIHSALAENGELLVVNQHTNSYFTKIRNQHTSMEHLDGWIAQSKSGCSYYGILDKDITVSLLKRYGFAVIKGWNHGQSNYVLVKGR